MSEGRGAADEASIGEEDDKGPKVRRRGRDGGFNSGKDQALLDRPTGGGDGSSALLESDCHANSGW